MDDNLFISNYLNRVHRDWERSRDDFPLNTYPSSQWPIPFFGNPRSARVATVGVNPSSAEFCSTRGWAGLDNHDWKERLRDYFNHRIPAHPWFKPWRTGLALLGVSYEKGTAAHFDVSYRATRAMLKNSRTDRRDFRRMVERDSAWFFKLLPLCPNLRLLLTFGPMVRADGSIESLTNFLKSRAPPNGFSVVSDGSDWNLLHEETKRLFSVHDADMQGEKDIARRVGKNLHAHREELVRLLQ